MNIGSLSKYKNIGYTAIIVVFIVGMILFSPTIFPQVAQDGEGTLVTTRSPSSPTDIDAVTISVTSADIETITLRYTFAGSDPIDVTMTSSGDTWSGTIPSKAVGVTVAYWVVGRDITLGKLWSDERSYTVVQSATTPPQNYDAVFIIYNYVDGDWVAASLGDTISGTIKIDLTVTEGASVVTRVSLRFLKQVDGVWEEQDLVPMASVAGDISKYTITYDTTKLANAVYDIMCDFYAGDTRVYTESLFNFGDGTDLGIDTDMAMLGLAGIVVIAVLMAFLKKRRK